MKIEITTIDGPNPWLWRVWQGCRCLCWGAEKDALSARTRAQGAMQAAKRRQITRWPRTTAGR